MSHEFYWPIKNSIGFKGKISEIFNAIFDIQLKSLFTLFDWTLHELRSKWLFTINFIIWHKTQTSEVFSFWSIFTWRPFLTCFQPPPHPEKEKLGDRRLGSREATDEQIAKEKTRNETTHNERTAIIMTQDQTTATEANSRADKIRGIVAEVNLNSKGNSHSQYKDPEEIAAANSGRAVEVFRRIGESANLSQRPRKKRRKLKLRKIVKKARSARSLRETTRRRQKEQKR